MLETENGKMTRQEYKQQYLYTSRRRTKSEVGLERGHHLEHSHSQRLMQPNKSEVNITVILAQ